MANLSHENQLYLTEAVAAGFYANSDLALDEAVGLLRMRDQLRTEVKRGTEQADRGELLPAEEVFDRLQQRVEQIEARMTAE